MSFSVALDIYKQSSYNIYIYFHKLAKQSLPLPLNFNVRLEVMRRILATNGDIYVDVGVLPRMKGLKGSINVATSINLAPLGWRTHHGKFVAGENNILSFSSPYSYKLFGLF